MKNPKNPIISFATGALLALGLSARFAQAATPAPRFNMVVIAELLADGKGPADDQHRPYVEAAKIWLNQLAKDSNFTVTYLTTPDSFTDSMLAKVDLIWQMNYAPYGWPAVPKAAFEKYMNSGKGGWLGIHHASLYGPAITSETWPLFFSLLGEINYKNYISKFASGNVRLEDSTHPVFKGVPSTFNVTTEEWYTWDKSPRPKVHVLANVDENSYKFVDASQSGTKMGDHPVVWTNDAFKGRNIYIFMGHHPNLYQNAAYVTLIRNSIMWAANKPVVTAISNAHRSRKSGAEPDGEHSPRVGNLAVEADRNFKSLPGTGGTSHNPTVLDAAGRTHFQSEVK